MKRKKMNNVKSLVYTRAILPFYISSDAQRIGLLEFLIETKKNYKHWAVTKITASLCTWAESTRVRFINEIQITEPHMPSAYNAHIHRVTLMCILFFMSWPVEHPISWHILKCIHTSHSFNEQTNKRNNEANKWTFDAKKNTKFLTMYLFQSD